jgi:M6 family metalloprotease-like protein
MRQKLLSLTLMTVFLLSACGEGQPASESVSEIVPASESVSTPTALPLQQEPPTPTASLRSIDSSVEVQLTLTNKAFETLDIIWVDFDGNEVPFMQLSPTQSETISTFSTHVWRVYEGTGTLIGEFVAVEEAEQAYEITADKKLVVVPAPASNSGSVDACKLPPLSFTNVGLGLPNPAFKMPSVGNVKTIVLFADFADVPAAQSPEDVLSFISPGAEAYFREMSYGKMNWTLEPYPVWLRMSQPSAHYGEGIRSYEGHLEFIQEAVTLADANVDFSTADSVIVLVPPQASAIPYGPAFGASSGGGYTADGKTFANGATSGADLPAWGSYWLNHETGHMMGLPDLYAYSYDTNNYPDQHRFVGDFSLMGYIDGSAPGFFAFERWQLKWLDDAQIICQTSADQTTTITPIETEGGIKAVIVPISQSKAVVVESRRPVGADAALVKSGILVYVADTSIYSGEGTIVVHPVSANDPYRVQSPLAVGETLTVDGVTITVIQADEQGDTVQVTVTK